MRGGSTILPGFMNPRGSKACFTSPKAAASRRPIRLSMNSERTSPSPCSPECDPPRSSTMSCTSVAMARMRPTSGASFRLSDGRTCRQPTEACAYQVPSAPCRSNAALTRTAYSARRGSGTAQSSMKETGFTSPGDDMTMLSPALRTPQTSAWAAGVSARRMGPGSPRSTIISWSRSSPACAASASNAENSTTSTAPGFPGKTRSTTGRKMGLARARRSTLASISSTAVGSRVTMCWTASSALSRSGKRQMPSRRCGGRRARSRSSEVKKASVPSEPTRSGARFSPGCSRRCRL